jgi:FdhD protein
MARRSVEVDVLRVADGARTPARDVVAAEEPLEIRLAGDTLAVTMRTPGHDRELALGFLLAEGLIAGAGDVATLTHCGRPGDEGFGNTLDVLPAPGVRIDPDARHDARRGTLITSACGVCGRRTVDELLRVRAPLAAGAPVSTGVVLDAVAAMRAHQRLFGETGGCHGASLFTFAGEHVATFEDIGRHNAVDKAVGAMLLAGRVPLAGHLLAVSGRAGFEIVQKAHAAGVTVVASVSAPSSLAVSLAARAGVGLAGFTRGRGLTVYATPERFTV